MSSILYSSHVLLFKLQFRFKLTYKSRLVKDGFVTTQFPPFPPYLTNPMFKKSVNDRIKKFFIRLGAQCYFRLSLHLSCHFDRHQIACAKFVMARKQYLCCGKLLNLWFIFFTIFWWLFLKIKISSCSDHNTSTKFNIFWHKSISKYLVSI